MGFNFWTEYEILLVEVAISLGVGTQYCSCWVYIGIIVSEIFVFSLTFFDSTSLLRFDISELSLLFDSGAKSFDFMMFFSILSIFLKAVLFISSFSFSDSTLILSIFSK